MTGGAAIHLIGAANKPPSALLSLSTSRFGSRAYLIFNREFTPIAISIEQQIRGDTARRPPPPPQQALQLPSVSVPDQLRLDQLEKEAAAVSVQFKTWQEAITSIEQQVRLGGEAVMQLNTEVDRTPTTFTQAAEQIESMVRGLSESEIQALALQERILSIGQVLTEQQQLRAESLISETFFTQMEQLEIQAQRIREAMQLDPENVERYSRALKQVQIEMGRATLGGQALVAIGNAIGSALEQSIQGVIQGTISLEEAFANMARAIVLSIIKIIIQLIILKALALALNAIPGGAGLLQLLGLAGAAASQAQKGAVVTGPQLMLVGENPARNPEFILNAQQMTEVINRQAQTVPRFPAVPTLPVVDDQAQLAGVLEASMPTPPPTMRNVTPANVQAELERTIGTLPHFQDGGMVTSPTLAVLGENPGRNPEFVLNRQQMEAVGKPEVIVNPEITVIMVDDRLSAEELAAQLPNAIIREVTEAMLAGPSNPVNVARTQSRR